MSFLAEQFVRLRPDLTGFRAEAQAGMNQALGGLTLAGAAKGALAVGGLVGGAELATRAIGGIITQGAELEARLNELRVTSGATGDEMAKFSDLARKLGADAQLPATSAGDAAAAMTELTKAGIDVQDTLDGTRGVLELAAAANLDVATATEIAASALNAFRLPGEDATRVADLLAGASIEAQGDIADFGIAMQQAAAAAAQVGVPIEDTVTALTLLAQRGIDGSDAGTSLRTMLLRLVPTTKEAKDMMDALGVSASDSAGNIRPLADIMEDYRGALSQLAPAQRQAVLQTIFGTDAFRAASIAIQEGGRGFEQARAAITETGIAAEVAGAKAEGLRGDVAALQSSWETLAATLSQATNPAIAETAQQLTDLINVVNIAATQAGRLASVDLAPGFDLDLDLGDLFGGLTDAQRDVVLFGGFAPIIRGIQEFRGEAEKAADASPFERLAANVRSSLGDLDAAFSRAGAELGRQYGDALEASIDAEGRRAVAAARRSLAQLRAEGERQIDDAVRSARNSLEGLGDSFASQLSQALDAGQLGQQIAEFDRQIEGLRDRMSQRSLRFDLSQAETDLREAQEAIVTVGKLTPAEKRSQDEFLAPFRQRMLDAKAALKEFDLTEQRDALAGQLEGQKAGLEDSVASLVGQFDAGNLSAAAFAAQLNKLVAPALEALRTKAGKNLGLSFTREFMQNLNALAAQAQALSGFPGGPGTAPGPSIVKPAETARAVRDQVTAGEAAMKAELERIKKGQEEQTKVLREIQRKLPAGGAPGANRPMGRGSGAG